MKRTDAKRVSKVEAPMDGAAQGVVPAAVTAIALEPRFLFDAAGVATAVEVAHADDHAIPAATPDTHAVDQQLLAGLAAQPAAADVAAQPAATPAAPAPAPALPAHEVVFVDASVPQYDKLLQGLPPATQVVTIDANRDGLAQIADALKGQQNVTAVHILSHGSAGEISLGNAEISSATLATHTAELDAIKGALAPGADILIYGCDVAQGEQGVAFVNRLAAATGADVAASVDDTGSATLGANWVLEEHTGAIETSIAVSAAGQEAYQGLMANILPGSAGWTPLMQGTLFDPNNDTQAKAADTDLVGDTSHAVLYGAYDNNGTPDNPNDDFLAFRIRIDNPTSSTEFGGVAVIGIDANQDGRIDLFLAVDGRNNTQAVRILDPGTGLNNSPNTTTTSALPAGWLPNNGVYSFTATNYSVAAVSAANDPQWTGNSDLGNDGKTDVFVSFKIPMADIASVLAKPSATDRSGNVGPRGTTGIAGFTKDTTVSYVLMTETQPGPINGDLGGVGANYDKNATFAQLGAITGPMTPSNPVAVGQSVTINHTIGDGNLSASEDGAVLLQGKVGSTTPNGSWVKITVTDSGNHSVTGYAQVSGGAWQMTKDLSSLNDGTLSVSAELWTTGTNTGTRVTNSVGDSTTVLHDRTPPVIAVSALATAGQPTISGTSDLPVGSTLTVTVDPNGDGILTDAVVYKTTVKAGNVWSIDTAVAAPFSGAVAAGGFTRTAGVAVSGTDDAGNSTSVLAITKPTVNTLTTNSVTPTISGTWGGANGGTDSLSVRVNNVTYTTATGLTITGTVWSVALTANTGANALASGQSYDVVATVTRTSPGGSTTDASVNELTVIAGPYVDIGNDGAGTAGTAASAKPTITGKATANAVVVLVIDLDNSSATTNDRVTYSATADGNGDWSVDLQSASPIGGTLPAAGLSGTVGLVATVTDSNGGTATDTKALTISIPSLTISGISNALPIASGVTADGILNASEDDAAVVTISATNVATNQTIAVSVSDGAHSAVTGTAVYDSVSGTWKATLNLSSLNDGTNNLTVTATYGQASASTTVSHDVQAFATVVSKEISSTSGATITGTADATASSLTVTLVAYKQNNGGGNNGTTYTAQTPIVYTTSTGLTFSNGAWSVPVPTSGGVINQNGEYYVVTVSGTDAAGNSVSASGQVTKISGTAPTVTIGAIATDNIIDATEDSALSITGTTSVSNGIVKVTVTDGTNSITQEVTASGTTWTLNNLNLHAWKGGPIFVEAQLLASSGSTTVWAEASATPTHTLAVPPTIAISTPIGDGNLSASEDSSVTVTGTTTNAAGKTVTVTVTDGTTTKTGTATVGNDGTWSATFTGANVLSGLNDATLQVSASVTANGSTATANASVLHDRTPPVVSIAPLLTAGTPVITGSSDLPAGSVITVTIDPDNVSGTASAVSYQATVLADHSWSVDLSSATPTSGSLPTGGLTAYAKITATGQDAAGNGTTATALDKPVVDSLLTNSTTPTVTGSWANIAGQTLYVVINGKAYGATAGQSVTLGGTAYTTVAGLSTSLDRWSVTTQALAAGTYEVAAYAVSGATQAADATANELVVDLTAPAVAIATITDDTGSSTTDWITKDGTLVFTGTAEANANVLVTLTNAAGATVFSTTVVATGGVWSVDRTGQAALADGAYTLTAVAKDAAGNSATATRSLTVDSSATLAVTTNHKAASTAPVITGSSDLEAGQSIDVTVNGATYRVQAQAGGGWSLDLATAQPTSGTKTALVDGQSYTITATGIDVAGNTATAGKAMLVDVSAPKVAIVSPLDWNGGNSNGVLTLAEDGSVVIKGTTAKGASTTALAGGQIAVTITDGTTTISDTATVQADGSWSLAALNLRGLANGTITVAATYVDSSGVAYTDVATVLHDKSGPVSIDGIGSDTGAPGDFVTADQTLVFRGSATAGQPVTVTLTNSGTGTVFSGTVTAGANGTWTYDNQGNTLSSGTYTLTATSNGTTATQAITVDAAAPAGPVTVASQTTGSVTPTITGTATVGAGETLTVTVNGKTYTAGDGSLTLTGTSWSLTIPASDALTPASTDNGFNGKYSVTATIRDTAGNTLTDTTSDELTITDVTKPVIDLDSVASGLGHGGTSTDGAAVSLDNDSAAATVVEANKLQNVTVTAGGLQNGSSEKLILGQTTVAADGSSGSKLDILVGNVRVNLSYASGVFTITKHDWSSLTAAEAQAVIRDIQYQNALGTGSTAGQRTFAFRTVDQAGNLSDAATATVTLASGSSPTPTPTQTVVISKAVDDVAPRTGDLASGAVTNDTAPELQGTISAVLGAGEVVAVYRGATRLGTATVTGTTWTYTDTALSNGSTYSYTARVENATNQGTPSTAFSLTIDTAAPSAPGLALVMDSGASGSDRISNVGTVTVSGLETGAAWEYTTNGGTSWTTGTGSSFTLAEGSYANGAVKVRQTDTAGNLDSEASLGATVIDATAPVVASATVSGTSLVLGYTEANRLDAVNLAGTNAFTVKVGGSTVTVSAVSVDAVNKTVTLTLGSAVVAGQSVTVSYADPTLGDDASATQDEAGNDAAGFTDRAVTNSTPATTPTQTVVITKAVDDVAPKVGDLLTGASTNDTAPELRGTISAALGTGEALAVYRDGVKVGTATVSGTNWTYADSGLSNGATYSYTARVENLVNPGTASTAFALTIDTTAPAAPALALATDSGTSASDRITKVGTVTVSGLESGATWEYSLDNGANWTAGSGSSIALSGDGAKSVLVRQTDAAGNTSANSAAFAFTLDTTVAAPSVALATDSGTSTNDGITKLGTLTVSGVEANATVQYSSDGSNWSVTAPTLNQGSNTVHVRQVDLAGNVSSATPITFTYDTAAPSAPGLALATDSGASGSDRISNVGTVTVSGLETGATWEYTTNGGTSWTTGTGNSFTLAEGSYANGAVKVRQTDTAGNLGSEASLGATLIDATAPVIASATVSGTSLVLVYTEANRLDAVNRAGTNAFTVKVGGSTVTVSAVSVDAANKTVTLTLGSAVVAGQSVTVSYADPTLGDDASATQDEAGNDAVGFTDRVVTNSTPATTPTQTVIITKAMDDVAPRTGDLTSGASTNDTAPELRGTISAALGTGEALAVYRDGVKIGTATVSGTNWTYADTSLSNGATYSYTARVENLVNPGTASTAFALTIDTTAPAAPALALATDSGTSASDRITKVGTVTVSGLESGATWEYSLDNGANWTAGSGSSIALSGDGAKSVLVRQTDAAGNTSANSAAFAFTLDTMVAAPSVALATDSGTSTNDGITKLGTLTVSGVEANATVQYSSNDSNWSATAPTLNQGSNTVHVRQVDLAGNVSSATPFTFTYDTAAPSAPGLALVTDSGVSGSDRNSNVGTVTVSGLETGATWEYTTNGGTNWTAGTGSSFTLAEGSYANGAVKVRQTDTAGNLGSEASLGATLIDATAPVIASATVSGTSLVLGYTEANRLDAVNRAGTNAFTVKVGGSTVTVSAVSVDAANKTVTLTLGSAVVAGQSVTVSYADPSVSDDTNATQDEAGNDAASFTDRAVTNATPATTPTQTVFITKAVDDVAPKVGDLLTGASTNDTAPELRGTISAALGTGEALAVYRDGVKVGTATVSGTNWTYADTGLSNGSTYSYTARVENLVNPGTASTAFGLTIDTAAPNTPAITSATDDAVPVIGTVPNGGVTNDSTPALTGTAEANSTVSVYDGATLLGTTTANGSGVWTYTPSTLSQGPHSFTVTATDAAGNVSGASTAYALTIDAAPVGTDNTISTLEDSSRTLTAADFGFTDADTGDTLVKVKVTQLPSAGTLALNGTAVVLDQEILRADIDAGKLAFTPAANGNGAGYASIAFRLSDGTVYADAANVLTIDVTPVNDAPVATASSVTMAEDATRAFQASDFGFTDVEGHGLAAVIITSRPAAGTLAYNGTALTAGDVASGFVVAAADLGKLTFTPARDANGTGYASFAFKVQDNGGTANGGQNTSAAATLTINVTPVNDAPTGADKTVGTAEDTPYTLAAADFGFADVDAGDALAAVTVTRLPAAGTLTLNGIAVTTDQVISRADIDAGKLVFTPAADANGAGYASFAFKLSDGALNSATANTITVDVSVVNDAPLAVAQTVAAVEDVERTITLSGTDVDGDALTYRVNRPAAGTLFQVNADGSRGAAITADGTVVTDGAHRVIYVSAVDGNGAGHGTFTFTVSDASVASAPATVTVNVAPVNDAPALTGTKATLAAGTEDAPYTIRKADLLAGYTDVDGDPLTVADLAADHGTLTDNGDGTWTFTPDADYNGPVSLTYSVTDGQGGRTAAAQAFALSAVNDAPALTGTKATLAAGTEDTAYVIRKADLLAGFTDADGDTLSVTGLTATNGTLTDNGDGTWTFTPNADYNGPVGLAYSVTDGKGGSVAASNGFAVAAANDAAVIGDPTSAAVTEDANVANGKLIATGTLSIRDVDAGEGTFRTTVGSDQGNLGSLALQADGTYAYSVDNSAVQFLGAGRTRTDSFTVTSFDGTSKRISFTITGVNDAAVIGGTDAGTVTEDKDVTAGGQLVTGGTLTIADTDTGEASVQPQAGTAGRYGVFALAADGRWTYAADNAQTAIQRLGAGETLTETFTVKALDSTTHTVTVTITGTNDAAAIGTPTVSSVTEDLNVANGALTAAGTIAISDADQGQAAFQTAVASSAGNLGNLTLQADGRYVYVVDNNAVQFLGAGQTKVDSFTVTSKDGTTRQVAITVNGANDAPAFTSGPASAAYADTSAPDTFQPFTGTLAARDADGNAVTFGIGGGTVQGGLVTKAGAYGTLTVNSATGAFAFVPDAAAIDALPGSVNPVETFTVTIADGQGGTASQTLTITLAGANETPAVTTTPVSAPTDTPVAQPAPPTVTAPTPVVLVTVEPTRPTTSTSVSQAVASVLSATAPTLPRASMDLTAQDTSPSVAAQTATARDPGGQSSSPTGFAPSSSYRGSSLLPPSVSFVASADTLGGASLITVGSVGDRVVTPGQPNLISVPAGTFQTSDPNAHITLQASLSDGSPLPAWLKFDSGNGTFSGNPPPDLKATISIKVIARDDQGAQATTEFRLNIGNNASDGAADAAPQSAPRPAAGRGNADGKAPAGAPNGAEEQPNAPAEATPSETTPASPEPGKRADADAVKPPVGKLAFSRQVNAQAPSGLLAEGEELLRSLQMLLAG
ncbi:Ig-like domain-containing protein [Azospirillum rugosum]|nr:Ig-like domain-containing protein [Azospirillum rugosum]